MSNTVKIEDRSRRQIAEFLPDALARAITSYKDFMARELADNTKKSDARVFSEHHSACKVCIAHIELLLKLARFADLPDASAAGRNQSILLAAMVREAKSELKAYKAVSGQPIPDAEWTEEDEDGGE